MRDRVWIRPVLLCGCVLLAFFGACLYVDRAWNGFIGDWVEKQIIVGNGYVEEAGRIIPVQEVYWPALKRLIFRALSALLVLGVSAGSAGAYFAAKAKEKRTVTEISREIREYMRSESDGLYSFRDEYAEVAAQMSGIRATIQRHEQLWKEEAARKSDSITYLAHDLKTPLTSVIGYLTLLSESPDMPSEQKAKFVGIALDKAGRLEHLINEFFEITRYNLHKVDLEREEIDLSYMLVQMTDEFYPLLTAHGNTVELNAEAGITVSGDSAKLARVFNNLLKNAVAYSYPDTVIHIWAEQTPEGTQVFFRNAGRTIPPQKLERIFEKFYRLEEARTTDTGGAGLGLAIAREIVGYHGGTLTVKSEQEITTFCVSLPGETSSS